LKYVESQLNDNQSPYMQNVNADDRGTLTKRPGQAYVYATSLGAGGINGAYNRLYKDLKVFAWGTGLYTQDGDAQPVSIMPGLTNAKGIFFVFNSFLYYINGTNFVQYDGTTAQNVQPYVPTVTLSRPPAGGGSVNEALNLLNPTFIDSFSPDGTATAYQLSQTGLDAAAVVASTDGGITYNKVEGTDFTVNRTTGVVTFTVAPVTGVNTVKIKAAKTNAGYANRVFNCTIAAAYGGDNETRMFLTGNPNYPNRLFRSDLYNAAYWPDTAFQNVGNDEAVTGLSKMGDKLIIFKERSIFSASYNNNDGTVMFPTIPINSAIGCNMTGSIQIIDNNIVFGNTETGLYALVSTNVKDEKVVRPISGNINGTYLRPGLLQLDKDDLQECSSVDYDGKYWLCIGANAYVWDYKLSPFVNTGNLAQDEERLSWFYYTGINASCWVWYDQSLFYGDRTIGQLVTMTTDYNDFGAAISAVWRSKLFNFNLPDFLKNITEIWMTTRNSSYSTITIKYINDNGEVVDTATIVSNSFTWNHFDWSQFTFGVSKFAETIRLKPKIKKVVYFQVEVSNNVVDENLSLLSLVIRYLTVRKVK
jgi:hypothetical protein